MKQLILEVLTVPLLCMILHAESPQQSTLPLNTESSVSEHLSQGEEDELLYREFTAILEDTVNEALDAQRRQLQKESAALAQSKSFWRRMALAEAAVIAASVGTGMLIYKMK